MSDSHYVLPLERRQYDKYNMGYIWTFSETGKITLLPHVIFPVSESISRQFFQAAALVLRAAGRTCETRTRTITTIPESR